jgi:hypothetical protein
MKRQPARLVPSGAQPPLAFRRMIRAFGRTKKFVHSDPEMI